MRTTRNFSLTRLLAAGLIAALLLSGCQAQETDTVDDSQPEVQEPQGTPATETENLVKLCKVWGYTKYWHPAFLLGKKDWDEELLMLIPQVREAETAAEVNELLHNWFVSLGEIDYGTDLVPPSWQLASEEDKVFIADTSWTADADALGEALAADLAQLPEAIPIRSQVKAPVFFSNGFSTFTNEPEHEGDYGNPSFRLLGMFRLWNAIEYYFPYLNLMDADWETCLTEAVPKMLEGADRSSYELNLLLLANRTCDPHVGLTGTSIDVTAVLGSYWLPVLCSSAEGKLVITSPALSLPLEKGDVLVKIDGRTIEELCEERRQYVSIPRDEVALSRAWNYLLVCENEAVEVTVLRDGRELTLSCTAMSLHGTSSPEFPEEPEQTIEPYELLEDNIGLINPAYINTGTLTKAMDSFRDTDGLIIDLRQYPDMESGLALCSYLFPEKTPALVFAHPFGVVPGCFIKQTALYGGLKEGAYHYDKPVAVLISSESMSRTEMFATIFSLAENTVLMGTNTMGTDGNVTYLPLPGGTSLCFTGLGVYEADGTQTQRTGIAPDIRVEPTIHGVTEGRDEVMEAAIEYIEIQSKGAN